jgi:tRNA A-37 threonylcarbamoyl transferase component Bud32
MLIAAGEPVRSCSLSMDAAFDPPCELPAPCPSVRAASTAWLPHRIQRVELDGRALWLKRGARARLVGVANLARDTLVRCAWPIVRWLPRLEHGPEALAREGRRLVALRAAGFAVPGVVAASNDWLLLEDCGESARAVLPRLDETAQTALLHGSTDDLVALHAAGFWHGGAQIKNTTLKHGRRHLIDFEDSFGDDITLPELHARDLFLLLVSCADRRTAQSLRRLVERYRAQGGSEEVVACAQDAVVPLQRRRLKWLPSGDVRRALAACDALRAVG